MSKSTNSTINTSSTEKSITFDIRSTPYFPSHIYDIIPEPLKRILSFVDDRRQKDIMLVSSIAVAASHCVNVKIPHTDGLYTPSFYFAVVAPPASGKGILVKAKTLGNKLQNHLIRFNKMKHKEYKSLSKEEKKNAIEPVNKTLFIPANTSSRALYDALRNNGGRGIIFETEMDTMSNATNQDWGNFSDVTRCAFHHEPISISRKDGVYHIKDPSLSICLSGTFDQFQNMFKSASNGNYSRYGFYTFSSKKKWKSHRPTNSSSQLQELLPKTSAFLFDLFQALKSREYNLLVELSTDQWNKLDSFYKKEMHQLENLELPDYVFASNSRMAIIQIRIASALCLIREFTKSPESIKAKEKLFISDSDFQVALEICSVLNRHSWTLYQIFFNQKKNRNDTERYRNWYNALPDKFTTRQAIKIGEIHEVPISTVKKWLAKGTFTKVEHGVYEK